MNTKFDPCAVCRGTSTRQTDGLLYCSTCGTQIENYQEYDQDDDGAVMYRSAIKTKKKAAPTREIDKDEEELLRTMRLNSEDDEPKKRKTEIMCEMFGATELHEPGRKRVDLEAQERGAHLKTMSVRIVKFADQLIKAANILSTQVGFPKNFPKQCFAVFQHYLQHCGVAFVDFEYTDDLENMIRVLSVGSKKNFKDNLLREKVRRKATRKSAGIKKLEKSQDIWGTLADKTLTEDLALMADGNDAFEDDPAKSSKSTTISQFEEINTNLSLSCARAAHAIYLEIDALVAILHISALNLGMQFLMLSDIVRWLREDRIRVPRLLAEWRKRRFHIPADMEGFFHAPNVRERLNIPLFEYERCSLWIWQSLNLPPLKMKIDYQQLTARTLYQLNLPSCLMHRISKLMQLAPPNDSLSPDALRLQGDIDRGISCSDFCKLRDKKKINLHFGKIRHVFGGAGKASKHTDVFFTTETKIMAYVLMALKLMYGLDDSSDGSENSATSEDVFNISDWMIQLKMRLMLCEGYDPFDVLQSERPIFDILPKFPLLKGNSSSFATKQGKIFEKVPYRGLGFTNCIPNLSVLESSANIPNALSDFVLYRSFNKNCDNALYAPVRHQPDVIHDFFEKNKVIDSEHYKEIDKLRLKLLYRQYDDYEMQPEKSSVDGSGFLASIHSAERCATNKERREWQKLFPRASTYTRYPRPLWAQGNVGSIGDYSKEMMRLNSRTHRKHKTINSGVRSFFASNRCVNDLFMAAEKSMSKSFRELLQNFSKIIGEDVALMYTAFIMLEYQIVERSEFQELARKLVDGVAFPLNVLRFEQDGESKNHIVQVTSDVDISHRRELSWLRFGVPKDYGASFWNTEEALNESEAQWLGSDSDSEEPMGKDSSSDPDDSMIDAPSLGEETFEERVRTLLRFHDKTSYDFDTIWQFVTMRYW